MEILIEEIKRPFVIENQAQSSTPKVERRAATNKGEAGSIKLESKNGEPHD